MAALSSCSIPIREALFSAWRLGGTCAFCAETYPKARTFPLTSENLSGHGIGRHQSIFERPKAAIGACAAKARFVRIAVIGSAKMLRFIANVRFGEAAPQRRNRLRMSRKGRSRRSTLRAGICRSLRHALMSAQRDKAVKFADLGNDR
jgi:hypothetical protein